VDVLEVVPADADTRVLAPLRAADRAAGFIDHDSPVLRGHLDIDEPPLVALPRLPGFCVVRFLVAIAVDGRVRVVGDAHVEHQPVDHVAVDVPFVEDVYHDSPSLDVRARSSAGLGAERPPHVATSHSVGLAYR